MDALERAAELLEEGTPYPREAARRKALRRLHELDRKIGRLRRIRRITEAPFVFAYHQQVPLLLIGYAAVVGLNWAGYEHWANVALFLVVCVLFLELGARLERRGRLKR